jgi:hypothetical protein
MSFKSKRQAILVKIEAAEGVDAAPTEVDAVPLASAPRFTLGAEFDNLNEDAHHGGLGQFDELEPAGEYGELTFEVWLRGRASGALLASSKPETDALWQICGGAVEVESTPGSEAVRYTFGLSSGEKSASIYWYEDLYLHKLLGARGRASILMEAGRPVKGTFTIRGLHSAEDAVSFPALAFSADPKPPLVRNSAFALGGWAAVWSRCQIDFNTELSMRPGPSAADALLPYIIGDYNPTMGLDPELVAVSTFDVRGQWRSKAGLAMSMGPIGTAAGNRIKISAPRTQLRAPGSGERNLYRTFDLTCGLKVDQGDDWLTIEFT